MRKGNKKMGKQAGKGCTRALRSLAMRHSHGRDVQPGFKELMQGCPRQQDLPSTRRSSHLCHKELQGRYLWWSQEKGACSCSPEWAPAGWWCKECWPWGRWHWQSSVSPALWHCGSPRGCQPPAPAAQSSQRPRLLLSRWAGNHPSRALTLTASPARVPPLEKDREASCYLGCRVVSDYLMRFCRLMSDYLMRFCVNEFHI